VTNILFFWPSTSLLSPLPSPHTTMMTTGYTTGLGLQISEWKVVI